MALKKIHATLAIFCTDSYRFNEFIIIDEQNFIVFMAAGKRFCDEQK